MQSISMNRAMVVAIRKGLKTVTRRMAKNQYFAESPEGVLATFADWQEMLRDRSPYGQPGDEVWVQEFWQVFGWYLRKPQCLCNIRLRLVSVEAERLHSVTQQQAMAEGIYRADGGWTWPTSGKFYDTAEAAFFGLWFSVYDWKATARSPWVWVLEFKVLEA